MRLSGSEQYFIGILLPYRPKLSVYRKVVDEIRGAHLEHHGNQKTEAEGGTFKLLNLTARHRELLVMTYLITHFLHFEDEAEAVASFHIPVEQAIK